MTWKTIKPRPDPVAWDIETVQNSYYTVGFRVIRDEKLGKILHLKISRNDGINPIAWEDLQQLKNEFAGEHVQAIEFYPPEKHLVNMAPVRHLWCFLDGEQLGFGYRFRATNLEELLGNSWSDQ